MKTINENIDIFEKLETARRAFNKSKVPCQLLETFTMGRAVWFLDRSKQAIIDWPKHYILLDEK